MIEAPANLDDTGSLLWFLATFTGRPGVASAGGGTVTPVGGFVILQEDGFYILQEDGGDILQQD